jgi:16S rRNA G966 N2-methylase RsmD
MVSDTDQQGTKRPRKADQRAREPVLRLDPGIAMRLGAGGDLQFKSAAGWRSADRFGALVLELFAAPRSFDEAFRILSERATGQAEMVEMLAAVNGLRESCVLVGDGDDPASWNTGLQKYSVSMHVAMLNDTERTERYMRAIEAVVAPGDTVIDLGAGTGVLSLAAARAGAAMVYAVEASDDVRMIHELCAEHVAAGTVEIIQGWSTSTSLPDKADVLVSEIIGNDPFDEQVLEMTLDARRRLLKSDARLIPSRLTVKALPVTIPDDLIGQHRLTDATTAEWARRWGSEFERLARVDRGTWQHFYLWPQEARDWPALAEPVVLADVELVQFDAALPSVTVTTEAVAGGLFNGVVVFFELELGEGIELSTHPGRISVTNCWRSPIWCVVDGRELAPGDPITINYRRVGGRSELDCE